jgi:2-amino-4-hydroxy-6-hydroxymethyldihydropteridine diphosphokinase
MRGYLSLGSNLGDRSAYLKKALKELSRLGVKIIKTSHIYETKPIDVPDKQRNYYNLVVLIEVDLAPLDLLHVCHEVEEALGRKRPYIHSPRTIDIDIILLEGIHLAKRTLVVPHPSLEERPFVIYPLAEIATDIVLPSGRPIIEVKNALGDDEILNVRAINYG